MRDSGERVQVVACVLLRVRSSPSHASGSLAPTCPLAPNGSLAPSLPPICQVLRDDMHSFPLHISECVPGLLYIGRNAFESKQPSTSHVTRPSTRMLFHVHSAPLHLGQTFSPSLRDPSAPKGQEGQLLREYFDWRPLVCCGPKCCSGVKRLSSPWPNLP